MSPEFWPTLGLALGLALAIEGLFYAAAAPYVTELLARVAQMGPARVRRMGIATAVAGMVWMLWLRFTYF